MGKPGKGRVTRPVNLTLRPKTIAAVKEAAAAQYTSVSRFVDVVLVEHLARQVKPEASA